MVFDLHGIYTNVMPFKKIAHVLEVGRKCEVLFIKDGNTTKVDVTFDAGTENPVEMQRGGWQAILERFKAHAEKRA